jgi:hypothetical protein
MPSSDALLSAGGRLSFRERAAWSGHRPYRRDPINGRCRHPLVSATGTGSWERAQGRGSQPRPRLICDGGARCWPDRPGRSLRRPTPAGVLLATVIPTPKLPSPWPRTCGGTRPSL